ncbi:MAG: response regulator [Gemmataceae bacterium]
MPDRPVSILIVDDDPDTRRNLSDILGDLGYRTAAAEDGPAALAEVARTPFDVVLLDFKMPGMNGLEVYRAIREWQPETVAIVISAYTDAATRQEANDLGVAGVLSKPLDFRQLLTLVEQAAGEPLVLVIDDDNDLCLSLWDLLRDRGYRVGLAKSGRAAADRLKDRHYNVVLVDMRLPDGDGTAVARTVHEVDPAARTVIITGHRGEVDPQVRQALAEGADAVCYKPFDVPGLLKTIEDLAGSKPAV